jgi:hypothetical protein
MLHKPSWLSQVMSLTGKTFRVLRGRPLLLFSSLIMPAIGFLLVSGIQKGLDTLQTSSEVLAGNLFAKPVAISGQNVLPEDTIIYYAPTTTTSTGMLTLLKITHKLKKTCRFYAEIGRYEWS